MSEVLPVALDGGPVPLRVVFIGECNLWKAYSWWPNARRRCQGINARVHGKSRPAACRGVKLEEKFFDRIPTRQTIANCYTLHNHESQAVALCRSGGGEPGSEGL